MARSLARRLSSFALVAVSTAVTIAVVTAQAPQAPAPSRGIQADRDHPILPIGSPAPDFSLPGVDGKIHKLSEYASAKILAIVFECNHCPTSQLYEGRIEKIYDDYKSKGLAIVSINPNNPASVRFDELGYTDMTDSLAEMKVRAAWRHFKWPYLYDGETQALATKFGVVATPHIYLFDKDRKLQYQGRIDDNQREELVKSQDARNALDAMLAGKPVPVANTGAFGCTTKWMSKATGVEDEWAKIKASPVTLELVALDDIRTLRANGTPRPVLFYFWPTSCVACATQLTDYENTYRMYHKERGFDMYTIAIGPVTDRQAALEVLKKQYATGPNKLFGGGAAALQAAWGATWRPSSSFTSVIGSDGKVLYQKEGKIDIVEPRRVILVNLPDTRGYIGQQAYWTAAVAAAAKK